MAAPTPQDGSDSTADGPEEHKLELVRRLGLQWQRNQELKGPKPASPCYTCGSLEHLARDCTGTICHFCGCCGHLARLCTFGSSLSQLDQFMFCSRAVSPPDGAVDSVDCFVRRFIIPLHAASPDFDPEHLTEGRVDVGCQCVTAALFRSESYRRNTEIRLTFCNSAQSDKLAVSNGSASPDVTASQGRTAVLTGGLIRGLRADERSVASRLRLAFDSPMAGLSQPEISRPERTTLGVRCVAGGLKGSIEDALAHGSLSSVILLLSADGVDIAVALTDLRTSWPGVCGGRDAGGSHSCPQVLIVLGDDRGLTAAQEAATLEAAATASNCQVLRVSLGPEVLLGSHCIVLVQHYMDRLLHCCPGKLFEVDPAVAKSANVKYAVTHRFTGSWDSTIRVWDVAESRCLYVSHDHHADVYGLSLHPRRPFFLVSSSRDTTIRFWIFEDIVRPLLVQALLHPESLSDLLGDSVQEASLAMESPVGQVPVPKKLFGKASRALATELQTLGAARPVSLQAYQKLLNFFMYRQGMEDLWGLVSQIRGETLPSDSSPEMVACQKSKALELASTRAQIGIAGKQEERLLKAAQIMCRVGDLRAYCRLTAQAGHWERAICIAPAVSHQFWQELCAEYMDTLSAATDTEEVAPFLVGIGRASRLVPNLADNRAVTLLAFLALCRSAVHSLEHNLFHTIYAPEWADAVKYQCLRQMTGTLQEDLYNPAAYALRKERKRSQVAKADCDGLLPCARALHLTKDTPDFFAKLLVGHVTDVAGVLAQRHLEQGEPLQAAMCFLAVSQPSRAVRTLARAQEVMLAFALSDLLGEPQDPVFLKLISQCAERDDRLELAAEILQMHPQGPSVHLPLLAARAKDQAGVRPWAPWTVEQHQERLAAALEVGDRPAAVLSAVCGGPATHTQAVQLGVEGLCELFARPGGWSLCEARALLDPLESVAIQDMGVKEIASSLACAAYVGLVEASMMGLHELMFPLAQTLRNIITHQNLQFPVSTAEISLLEASCTSHRAPAQALQQLTSLLEGSDLPPNLRAACEQQAAALRQRAPADEWPDVDGPGLAMMAGGHLPACYKRFAKTSVLTNQRIKGPAFQLEDRKMHVSLSDALAWARVNAFSPLNTGCKIYPI
ncbi:unnamed protein product [Polarella glacialis]|uniref:CCHC-type domain-containing protein n=1 Tax=Polarella glacialis TaxID=89957 RepID=A0A813K644_POLGL|nr:unnamed protein product [Polarella glacialis]